MISSAGFLYSPASFVGSADWYILVHKKNPTFFFPRADKDPHSKEHFGTDCSELVLNLICLQRLLCFVWNTNSSKRHYSHLNCRTPVMLRVSNTLTCVHLFGGMQLSICESLCVYNQRPEKQ